MHADRLEIYRFEQLLVLLHFQYELLLAVASTPCGIRINAVRNLEAYSGYNPTCQNGKFYICLFRLIRQRNFINSFNQ